MKTVIVAMLVYFMVVIIIDQFYEIRRQRSSLKFVHSIIDVLTTKIRELEEDHVRGERIIEKDPTSCFPQESFFESI
jgi:hypothetical protein